MRKFRLYYDKEKEEEWLNEMCRKGWGMTNFFLGFYTFEPCASGEYTYQVDFPDFQRKKGNRDQIKREYIEFVEATGAEYVCSWVYCMIFCKETLKGNFKLYTDTESEIKLFQRFRRLFLVVDLIELFLCMFQIGNYINYINHFWSPNLGENILMVMSVFISCAITTVVMIIIFRITRKINKLKHGR